VDCCLEQVDNWCGGSADLDRQPLARRARGETACDNRPNGAARHADSRSRTMHAEFRAPLNLPASDHPGLPGVRRRELGWSARSSITRCCRFHRLRQMTRWRRRRRTGTPSAVWALPAPTRADLTQTRQHAALRKRPDPSSDVVVSVSHGAQSEIELAVALAPSAIACMLETNAGWPASGRHRIGATWLK